MQYKKVPLIEDQISAIGLGCWNFGGDWDRVTDDRSREIIHTAVDNGVNLFDVAPVYGFYHSEEVLGKVLREGNLRDKVLIATKCGLLWDENRVTRNDLTKDSILREIDQSLQRLQTDHVDVYQLHWPDPNTPLEETAEALRQIVDSGKARYIGLTNFSLADAKKIESLITISTHQSLYNMLERNTTEYHGIELEYKTEDEILPHVREMGQAFFPYSPLFQGLLSGRFKRDGNYSDHDIRNANPKFKNPENNKFFDVAEDLGDYADSIGKPLYEIATNWLRQKEEVTSIIAGASSPEQMKKNVHCMTWELTDEMLADIEKIIAPFKDI